MTKESCIKKTEEIIDKIPEYLKRNLDKLMNSGAVDYENAEDNYLLPKRILCALLMEEERQYRPDDKDKKAKKEIQNFYNWI